MAVSGALRMRSYVSLWSADLLAIGEAVAVVDDAVDGFHIDVFDGHNVKDLLFGPDFVAALRQRTSAMLDVHLNVDDPDYWADRFIDAGADMITVQLTASADIAATLHRVRGQGCRCGIGLELRDSEAISGELFAGVDRMLVMGTEIGVKGVGFQDASLAKVGALVGRRPAGSGTPEVVVDGGIRDVTVPSIAAAGVTASFPGHSCSEPPIQPAQSLGFAHLARFTPLEPMSEVVAIGVDLGGTKIAASVVGPDGTLLGPFRWATTPTNYESALGALVRLVERLSEEACDRDMSVIAVGVAAAAFLNPDRKHTPARGQPRMGRQGVGAGSCEPHGC